MKSLLKYFNDYPTQTAPFMHEQYTKWGKEQPLKGTKVIHHVPLVKNTLLKIACLVAAGADVIVTNPSFLAPHIDAITALEEAEIPYVSDINSLKGKAIDIYFDCGAELYQVLGAPKIGSIELTGSGDDFYRSVSLDFPVISIDRSYTKQLETIFGCAESANLALKELTKKELSQLSWLIFGFGKIGRGLAYHCVTQHLLCTICDIDEQARKNAELLGVKSIDPNNIDQLREAVNTADIIITATGKASILNPYPKEWFRGKILANMGILDEFGDQFLSGEVLNKKLPINFILNDPTPMKYIDPEFFAHNAGALILLKENLTAKVYDLPKSLDEHIVQQWCQYHKISYEEIAKWFISYENN